jgi:hypothetical protein
MSKNIILEDGIRREVTDGLLEEMVADESFDCLVDLSGDGMFLIMPLSAMRKLDANPPPPNTLYGIPIVFTEDHPVVPDDAIKFQSWESITKKLMG